MISPLDRIRIVLLKPRGAANVGGAARALANSGLSRLVVVSPAEPLTHPDTVSWATDATDVLEKALVVETLDEALADTVHVVGMTARRRHMRARHDLRELSPRILEAASSGPVAILFGPETSGLSNEALDACQELAVIRTAPEHRALNLAGAVLTVAHELYRAAHLGDSEPAAPAESVDVVTHEERRRLIARCHEVLDLIGYTRLGKSYSIGDTINRLAMHGRLERRDLRNLLAVLRHLEWMVRGE